MEQALDDLTVDELIEIATDLDITGRHDMRKDELIYAINQETEADSGGETPGGNAEEDGAQQPEEEEPPEESDEQQQEADEEQQDETSDEPLTDDELPWDVADVEVGDEVMMNHLSLPLEVTDIEPGNPHQVHMTTNRGGKHMLRIPRDGEARLMRWRAGDQEWMYNSIYPEQFDLPDAQEFEFVTDVSIPTSVADDADEAKAMAVTKTDTGELEVTPVDVEETEESWVVTLEGRTEVTGFGVDADDINTGDF